MPLSQFVELVRMQTKDDYRPNKDVVPGVISILCVDYKNLEVMLDIVREGVRISTTKDLPLQQSPPRNHSSATERLNVLRKNIRKEQDAYRCLVLDLDLLEIWPEVRVSPFGIADKSGGDPTTSGHQEALNRPKYRHCNDISAEVLRLKSESPDEEVFFMAGDIISAFRNANVHSESVHLVAGAIEEEDAFVIELAAAFGWTVSPGCYEVYSGTISHVHGHFCNDFSPHGFFSYHWVDDHVNVSRLPVSNLSDEERSLRFAMVAILGPGAINEEKFSRWHKQLKVLGLMFDTVNCTVAMPDSKITKARGLVVSTFHSSRIKRTQYRSLLGSLRHVATCTRAARPFLQRLRSQEFGAHHRFGDVVITPSMKEDPLWWWQVLQSPDLNGVPMRFFHVLPSHGITVEMDAFDFGLCALDVTNRRFFTYRFSADEADLIAGFKAGDKNEFDINFRELLSAAFAVRLWHAGWSASHRDVPVHVLFRIDNTSAIAWQSKMSSRNSRAQTLIRMLGHWEYKCGLRFSSSHVAGVDNVRADLGSRLAGHDLRGPPALRDDLTTYLRAHSAAPSIFTKYETAFQYWSEWCRQRGFDPFLLGLNPSQQIEVISGYVIHGFRHGFGSGHSIKSSSIALPLQGVKHFFQASGQEFLGSHAQVRMLLKGVGHFVMPKRSKAPVSIALMEPVFHSLRLSCPEDQALWFFLCISLFFLLHRSKITASHKSEFQWFSLRAEDLVIVDSQGDPTSIPELA